MVNKDGHGKIDCNLGKRPIPFIALFIENQHADSVQRVSGLKQV